MRSSSEASDRRFSAISRVRLIAFRLKIFTSTTAGAQLPVLFQRFKYALKTRRELWGIALRCVFRFCLSPVIPRAAAFGMAQSFSRQAVRPPLVSPTIAWDEHPVLAA